MGLPSFHHLVSVGSTDPVTSLSSTVRHAQKSLVLASTGCIILPSVAAVFDASPTVRQDSLDYILLSSDVNLPSTIVSSISPYSDDIVPGSTHLITLVRARFLFISLPPILHVMLQMVLRSRPWAYVMAHIYTKNASTDIHNSSK